MRGELEHEIIRETPRVPFDLFIQALYRDPVDSRQILIEDHTSASNEENGVKDLFGFGDRNFIFHGGKLA